MLKCGTCGKDNKDTAKFCTGCGGRLGRSCPHCGATVLPEAKFCAECGASALGASSGAQETGGLPVLTSIPLSPLVLDLPECRVEIREVKAEGPDDDGDLRVEVKYEIGNDTGEDWDYLDIRVQILDAAGRIIEETRDTQEQRISAGDTGEFETGFWGLKAALLGPKPEQAHVVVSVVACGLTRQAMGEFPIPAKDYEAVALRPSRIGDQLQLVSGSLWKNAPDDDGDCRVEVRAMIQNLTGMHLPLVKLDALITDNAKRELTDAGGSDEVRPGCLCVLAGSGYDKAKKMVGAKVTLTMLVHHPLAAAVAQQQGMQIVTAEEVDQMDRSEVDCLNCTNSVLLYANMKWFDVAEQPSGFDQLPEEFQQAKLLMDTDAEGNQEKIIELIGPFVKAWFLPSNLSNWEELFADPEGAGFLEIPAVSTNVVAIDFADNPIPICKAEAKFEVPVTESFAMTDLEAWQEENDPFTFAISFYWDIPRTSETEDLDFTYGNHQGVECIVISDEAAP